MKLTPQHLPIFLVCLSTLFMSCKNTGSINMGGGDELTAELTDSIEVIASTYLLDSLPTSATGSILVGTLEDADMGKVNVSSYMQIKTGFVSGFSFPEKSRFDSLNLVLIYGTYSYGDTLATQQLLVNRLTERMVLRTPTGGIEDEERPVFVSGNALYSSSRFNYEPAVLGQRDFRPRPKSKDSVWIKLSNTLGTELFQLIGNKDKRTTDADEFQDYFRGIVLRSANGKSVTAFMADSTKIFLHYSYQGTDGMRKSDRLEFTLNSAAYQFNHIDVDRSQTKISSLNYSNREVKSGLTEEQLFLQGGTGLVTKLQLPGLLEFLKEPRVVINKMQLIVETKPETYATFKPPSSLILFIANSANTPKSILTASFSDISQQAYFQKGDEAGSSGRYIFELGEYANDLRKGLHHNTSLLLSLPVGQLTTSLDRLHMKSGKAAISVKTKLIYTKY
ncbi:DUF4270 family protein [Pedobacter heparinus]|uniref:DUF4270 family protein n=1 Tax=Pedobacter heparinus TaxID=984 RepID=UPI0029309980|nr:DUF4270 family protein [Pedobacter heparinus]